MLLSEAKQILKDNGFLCENARGKTNIEDFNKMKKIVSEITHLSGTCFEFITTTWGNLYKDDLSQMCIAPYTRKGYSYDTGRPGFKRYRKLSKAEAVDLIKEHEQEIKAAGFKIFYDRDDMCIISMPKTPLEQQEKEDGPIGYWTCGFGDGRINYMLYGMRYLEDGVEYPKNIKAIAERAGERKFTMYFSVDRPNKHSSYEAMKKALEKGGYESPADEKNFMNDWDAIYVAAEK